MPGFLANIFSFRDFVDDSVHAHTRLSCKQERVVALTLQDKSRDWSDCAAVTTRQCKSVTHLVVDQHGLDEAGSVPEHDEHELLALAPQSVNPTENLYANTSVVLAVSDFDLTTE